MIGATVVVYPQLNSGGVLLEVYAGDKRRGAVDIRSKSQVGIDYFDDMINPSREELVTFLDALRDAAIEVQKEADHA